MKPPVRRRLAPSRFVGLECPTPHRAPIRLAWMAREKVDLLRGLKAQVDVKVPQPPVQGRSKSEVSAYVNWLRGRAAREAVQTVYEKWVKERRAQEAESPAPIELWSEVVGRMSSCTEKIVCAAFSQMLTIASTEPMTLHHSIPSKAPRKRPPRSSSGAKKNSQQGVSPAKEPVLSEEGTASSVEEGTASLEEKGGPSKEGAVASMVEGTAPLEEKGILSKEGTAASVEKGTAASVEEGTAGSVEEGAAASVEGTSPSEKEPVTAESCEDRWKKLDFEKIYKYLAKATTEENLPKLSECESAVVLHLLHCIPDQLQTLNAEPLGVFLRNSYASMNTPVKLEDSAPEETPSSPLPPQTPNWKELGFCPLNPFLVPLELLKPKEHS